MTKQMKWGESPIVTPRRRGLPGFPLGRSIFIDKQFPGAVWVEIGSLVWRSQDEGTEYMAAVPAVWRGEKYEVHCSVAPSREVDTKMILPAIFKVTCHS